MGSLRLLPQEREHAATRQPTITIVGWRSLSSVDRTSAFNGKHKPIGIRRLRSNRLN